jgi:hypothetical protein
MKPKGGRTASKFAEHEALTRQVIQAVKSMMVGHNGGPPLDDADLEKKIGRILSEASERRIAGAGDNLKTDPASEPATMSVEEFAAEVPMGRNQAYQAVLRGEIPHIRFGKRIRVLREAARRMLRGEALQPVKNG